MPRCSISRPALPDKHLRRAARPIPGLALVLLFFLAAALGCASARGDYGDHVRFSPAYQGYVMARNDGSDDPAKDAPVLVLRDPIGGKKLRCQEEVLEWRELYEDVAADRARDSNAAITASITTGAVFAPLMVMAPVGGLVFLEALSTGERLYDALRSASATELLAAGIVLHDRKRYPRASLVIEHALAKDSSVGTARSAYLYLGLSYLEQGNRARARTTLNAFVERAAVRDADGYRRAEAALKTLGYVRKPCASVEPVELRW